MRALVAAGRAPLVAGVQQILRDQGLTVSAATGPADLWRALSEQEFDLVVVERALLGPDPADALGEVRAESGQAGVVVIGHALGAVEHARLSAAGSMAVLDAGLPAPVLSETLDALVERRRRETARRLGGPGSDAVPQLSDFASNSPAMQRLLDTAQRVAATDSTFLVLGETGVGKEWVSRAIHAAGPRASGPFVAVNCGALPDTLLESELFGHEKGAFTGAVRSHRGYFELAHRGTLFLDEIGEMPPNLQVRLLRVLEEKQVWPVGGEKGIRVDVRIIAATNRSPDEEIAAGRLRRDLYYRLGVLTLTVPPLRERREDIEVLTASYVERYAAKFGRSVDGPDRRVIDALVAYDWPGNVRELINVVERAVLLSDGGSIGFDDLPESIRQPVARTRPSQTASALAETADAGWPSLAEARRTHLQDFERAYLAEVLARSGGRIGEAASRAGLDPRTLYEKMRALGLRKESFKYRSARGSG